MTLASLFLKELLRATIQRPAFEYPFKGTICIWLQDFDVGTFWIQTIIDNDGTFSACIVKFETCHAVHYVFIINTLQHTILEWSEPCIGFSSTPFIYLIWKINLNLLFSPFQNRIPYPWLTLVLNCAYWPHYICWHAHLTLIPLLLWLMIIFVLEKWTYTVCRLVLTAIADMAPWLRVVLVICVFHLKRVVKIFWSPLFLIVFVEVVSKIWCMCR